MERFQRAGTVVGVPPPRRRRRGRARRRASTSSSPRAPRPAATAASFLGTDGDDLIGLASLVPQVADATGLPVVAAGGIVDGRGVRAALDLGACSAQLGTAFLLCPEAGTSAPYREAVRNARSEDTVVTSAFSGRRGPWARQPIRPRPPRGGRSAALSDHERADQRPTPSVGRPWGRRSPLLVGRSECRAGVREMAAADLVGLIAAEAGYDGLGPPPGESLAGEAGHAPAERSKESPDVGRGARRSRPCSTPLDAPGHTRRDDEW